MAYVIAQPGGLQHMPRRREGVGDDHVCASADVVFVDRANRLGVAVECGCAPGKAVHGHAAALEFGASRAIQNDELALVEPGLQVWEGCHSLVPVLPRYLEWNRSYEPCLTSF